MEKSALWFLLVTAVKGTMSLPGSGPIRDLDKRGSFQSLVDQSLFAETTDYSIDRKSSFIPVPRVF